MTQPPSSASSSVSGSVPGALGGVSTLRQMAPRRTRIALAYGYMGAVAVAAASPLLLPQKGSAVVELVAVIAMAGLWWSLRRATQLVADAPEESLDALVARLRNRAYLLAYQLLAVVALLISAVLLTAGHAGLSRELATAMGWAGLGCALGLPLVVTAVAFPDRGPGS